MEVVTRALQILRLSLRQLLICHQKRSIRTNFYRALSMTLLKMGRSGSAAIVLRPVVVGKDVGLYPPGLQKHLASQGQVLNFFVLLEILNLYNCSVLTRLSTYLTREVRHILPNCIHVAR
jgi:hypothetical protein